MVEYLFDSEVEKKLENNTSDEAILPKFGIKEANEEIFENTKVKDFLNYCRNNNVQVINFDENIHTKLESRILLYLIEHMDSFDKVINVLNNTSAREQAVFDYEIVAKWYNIYDPNKLPWFSDDYDLLLDEDYLENASVDWTQDEFYNFNSWFYYKDGQYVLKPNSLERGDYDYINPFYDNVYTLKMEKEKRRLKQVIDFLINSTLKK